MLAESSTSKFLLGSKTSKSASPVSTFTVNGGGINDMALSPDGTRLAVACHDGALRVLDMATGTVVGGFQVRLSPQANFRAGTLHCLIFLHSTFLDEDAICSRSVLCLDAAPFTMLLGLVLSTTELPPPCIAAPLQSYYGAMITCSFSPDGKYIAAGGEDDMMAMYGLQVSVNGRWDV